MRTKEYQGEMGFAMLSVRLTPWQSRDVRYPDTRLIAARLEIEDSPWEETKLPTATVRENDRSCLLGTT